MRSLLSGLKVLAGIVAGLVLAELAFRVRSGGAFPHLNFYEPDSALGVHLAPHAQMQLSFSGNPTTHVETNSLGFRGPEWPATAGKLNPDNHEVLVVGDSQVFGLGVEHAQTFSSQLEAALGGGAHVLRVLNAGVPTYGPLEYTALVERLVAERKPARVVYVFNVANDLFELERPNNERHAVWDGWAVRTETAPRTTLNFPLRRWFMSQSQAVFALRSWLRGLEADDAQFASEGGFSDLAARAKATPVLQPSTAASSEKLVLERARLADSLETADSDLVAEFSQLAARDKRYLAAMRNLGQVEGDPRDIVQPVLSESARPVRATAFHLLFAALALEKNDAMLTALAKKSGQSTLLERLEQRRKMREDLAKTTSSFAGRLPNDAPNNVLDQLLARTQRACDAVQAELMVVVLPLDVQVSRDEWNKYGQGLLDMSATESLNQDIAARAKRLGLRVLDATAALRAVEPGAFLHGDLHMSPRGHAALGRAIAAAWAEPLPPNAALPQNRSVLPAADEWRANEPAAVSGDGPEDCTVTRVREWWRVHCRTSSLPLTPHEITSMTVLRGGHGDVLADLGKHNATPKVRSVLSQVRAEQEPQLIAPVLPGDVLDVQFGWARYSLGVGLTPHHARTLRIEWRDGADPRAQWGPVGPAIATLGVQPNTLAAVINNAEIPLDARCLDELWREYHKAIDVGQYEIADNRLREGQHHCQLGQARECGAGEVAFGVLGRCTPACSRDKPCAQGRCVADRGRFGCITP